MRKYDFDLPVKLSFYASFIPRKLAENNLWDALPCEIQLKMSDAAINWTELILTQDDLDSIDDNTWNSIYELVKPFL